MRILKRFKHRSAASTQGTESLPLGDTLRPLESADTASMLTGIAPPLERECLSQEARHAVTREKHVPECYTGPHTMTASELLETGPKGHNRPCDVCLPLIDTAQMNGVDFEYLPLHRPCYEAHKKNADILDLQYWKHEPYLALIRDAQAGPANRKVEDGLTHPHPRTALSQLNVGVGNFPPCPGPPPTIPLPARPQLFKGSPWIGLHESKMPVTPDVPTHFFGQMNPPPSRCPPTFAFNALRSHTDVSAMGEAPCVESDYPCAYRNNEFHILHCGHLVRTNTATGCGRNCDISKGDRNAGITTLPDAFACPRCIDDLLNAKYDSKRKSLENFHHALASQMGLARHNYKIKQLVGQRSGREELGWLVGRSRDREILLAQGRPCEAVPGHSSGSSSDLSYQEPPNSKPFYDPGHKHKLNIELQGKKFIRLAIQQANAFTREGESVDAGVPIVSRRALQVKESLPPTLDHAMPPTKRALALQTESIPCPFLK